MTGQTERCYLCGTEIPEGSHCKNARCRASWEAYEAPMREAQEHRHKPVARRDEGEVDQA